MTIRETPTAAATAIKDPASAGGVPIVDAVPLADQVTVAATTKTTTTTSPPEQPDTAATTSAIVDTKNKKKETKESCSKRSWCYMLVALVLFIAMTMTGFALGSVTQDAYVCGSQAPTQQELESTGLPSCVSVSILSGGALPHTVPNRPLCLAKPSQDGQPPKWCYEDVVPDEDDEDAPENYYLWWSPCQKCGTAWRMFREKKDDESWFKLPTETKPGSTAAPPSSDAWGRWWAGEWKNVTVSFTECDASSSSSGTSFVLPDECFREEDKYEHVGKALRVVGIAGIALCFLIVFCKACCAEGKLVSSSSGGGGGHRRTGGNHYGGGGCGGGYGGGGGCGGGGGGGGKLSLAVCRP